MGEVSLTIMPSIREVASTIVGNGGQLLILLVESLHEIIVIIRMRYQIIAAAAESLILP